MNWVGGSRHQLGQARSEKYKTFQAQRRYFAKQLHRAARNDEPNQLNEEVAGRREANLWAKIQVVDQQSYSHLRPTAGSTTHPLRADEHHPRNAQANAKQSLLDRQDWAGLRRRRPTPLRYQFEQATSDFGKQRKGRPSGPFNSRAVVQRALETKHAERRESKLQRRHQQDQRMLIQIGDRAVPLRKDGSAWLTQSSGRHPSGTHPNLPWIQSQGEAKQAEELDRDRSSERTESAEHYSRLPKELWPSSYYGQTEANPPSQSLSPVQELAKAGRDCGQKAAFRLTEEPDWITGIEGASTIASDFQPVDPTANTTFPEAQNDVPLALLKLPAPVKNVNNRTSTLAFKNCTAGQRLQSFSSLSKLQMNDMQEIPGGKPSQAYHEQKTHKKIQSEQQQVHGDAESAEEKMWEEFIFGASEKQDGQSAKLRLSETSESQWLPELTLPIHPITHKALGQESSRSSPPHLSLSKRGRASRPRASPRENDVKCDASGIATAGDRSTHLSSETTSLIDTSVARCSTRAVKM